ncbi:hypothetical protein EMIHUDRAFT_209492 [Emiliania huxleyi CCMP1516]|uniref:Uncharacterized protein n=2 Tax=Emiliania huxleyi TaxID=2903 RepID=A0A0D3J5T1_EMIH1|nr:hypothetical protein EMIHUDRAFT_209492 [Emiliania huxleyi CCMP1516]EOD18866.1 hypothetical protein EMIHUDRAFT_209492 [Emiliania huxleyi CCMP1516]|eukprot:XP_005771295.1 hypothetical protein EMIHUDRAFT_209492 [Emiliania huxleyi CCMP1516]
MGSVVAGTYTGVMQFTFAAACASIIFAPVGLPLAIGIQHGLVGFVVTQAVVARTTSVRGGVALAVPSFEVLPFLARFAAPVDNIDRLLPPPLQAGLFAAIGWSLYLLSFDVLGLGAGAGALLTLQSARLWVPANLFGLGLWRASRKGVGEGRASGGETHPAAPINRTSLGGPLLIPIFILAVSALVRGPRARIPARAADALAGDFTLQVHGLRLATGCPVPDARAAGWLMAEVVGEPASALWRSLSPSLVRWDVLFSAAALKQLVPLVNTVLNYVLYGPLIRQKLDLKTAPAPPVDSTRPSAWIGGLDRFSCYFAAAVSALFLCAYPLCGLVGYLPTLAIAGICVYVGCDFLYDNLVEATRANGARAGLAAATVLAVCVWKDMLHGSLLGIAGAQACGWWQRRQQRRADKE